MRTIRGSGLAYFQILRRSSVGRRPKHAKVFKGEGSVAVVAVSLSAALWTSPWVSPALYPAGVAARPSTQSDQHSF